MKYFAYGSNMSIIRLRERVPSAEKLGTFTLNNHALRFHKASEDGSGKCDAYQIQNSNDFVIGVVFNINAADKPTLDKAEGLGYGYQIKTVSVQNTHGQVITAFTYYAIQIDPTLKPYSWYLNHVVIGAKQANLPAQYLNAIKSTKSIKDKDHKRDAQQRAMYD